MKSSVLQRLQLPRILFVLLLIQQRQQTSNTVVDAFSSFSFFSSSSSTSASRYNHVVRKSSRLNGWHGSSNYLEELSQSKSDGNFAKVNQEPEAWGGTVLTKERPSLPQQQQQHPEEEVDEWAYLAAAYNNHQHEHAAAPTSISTGSTNNAYYQSAPATAAATVEEEQQQQAAPSTPPMAAFASPQDYTLQRNYPHLNGQAFQEEEMQSISSLDNNVHDDVNDKVQQEEREDEFLRTVSSEIRVKKFLGQNTHPITDIPLGLAASRFIDTIEDALVHMRRVPYKIGIADLPDFSTKNRPTVVVLGTGWAAHAFSKVACTFDLKLIVVSPVNHFVFTPMLAGAAVGTVEYRSMTEPIRVSNPTIDNYIEGKAVAVDVDNRRVTVELTSLSTITPTNIDNVGGTHHPNPNRPNPSQITLDYDYLICAPGTKVRSSIVPGAEEHCFNLKTSIDSKKLRTGIGEALEYASRPDVQGNDDPFVVAERRRRVRFCIIGGGATGVELAGELNDFLKDICRPRKGAFHRLADDVSVMLVHGGDTLVPQFDPELRPYALEALQQAGVEVRLNTRTTEVTPTTIKLKRKGDNTVEEEIPVGLTVWAAGNEPVPFVKTLLSQLPERAVGPGGRVNVDGWLRVPTHTPESFGSILVVGDAAYLKANPKDEHSGLPQTAQVAGQQGAFAARLLNRDYDLQETPPKLRYRGLDEFSKLRIYLLVRGLDTAPDFIFLNLGLLCYVGEGKALTQVMLGDVPILNRAGRIAFQLWRSVYLGKQASTRNRALVVFDWFKSEIFGRDITRL